MNILHCIIQYFPNYVAGTEVYTHTLALYQKSKGHQVAVAVPYIQHYASNSYVPHYQYDTVDVFNFIETANPADRNIYAGKKKPEGLGNFLQLLQKLQPDVVHFQELNRSIGLTVAHVQVAKQFGAKVIVTMHLSYYTCNTNTLIFNNSLCSGVINNFSCTSCSYQTKFNIQPAAANVLAAISISAKKSGCLTVLKPSKLTSLLSMPLYVQRINEELVTLKNNVHQIVVLTNWYKKILIDNKVPDNKISLIPQAIATLQPITTYPKKISSSSPIQLIFIGRTQPQKGVHLLIEALQSFTEHQFVLDIYGKIETSSYGEQCKRLSKEMTHVHWKGLLQRDEVLPTIARYDFLCLPSLFSEMSPLVIQEAFATNTPIIASKVYGNMEQIVDGQNGFLVDFNSVSSIVQVLNKILANPSIIVQMSQQISGASNFESIGETYMQLYQSV